MRKQFPLPASSRIKKRKDILSLQSDGRKFFSKHFLIIARDSSTQCSRLAITITKKVDKRAVARNALKRRLRELFRLNQDSFTNNFDILIIARQNATKLSFADIRREICGAWYHNGLLKSFAAKVPPS